MNLTAGQKLILMRVLKVAAFSCAIFILTRLALQFARFANPPTVGFSFLIIVLLAAFFGDTVVAISVSLVGALCFNFFFLPPIGTFNIAAFDDWISLAAFLLTAIAISRLTASARANSVKSINLEHALVCLKDFGVWLLGVPHDRLTLSGIAQQVIDVFGIEYCSIHVYVEGKWHHFTGAAANDVTRQIAGRLKYLEDHPTNVMELVDEQALGVRYTQIRQGMSPLALLVVKSEDLPGNALAPLAYMIGVRLVEILQDKTVAAMNLHA